MRFASVVPIVLVVGCTAPPHVEERGAEKVAGTDGVGGTLQDVYAVSPSGNLVLFSRERANRAASNDSDLTLLNGFVLLDRATGATRDVGVDAASLKAEVERHPELLLGALCWSDAEDSVRLGVSAGPNAVLDLHPKALEWRLGTRPSPPDPAVCPPFRKTGQQMPARTGRFVIGSIDGGIRVMDAEASGDVLLDYRGALLARDTYVSDVQLAPGGRRIALVVSRGTGSFTGAPELFVLSTEPGEPRSRSLGGPVFFVRWSRRGNELFAVADTRGDGRRRAIYRWAFTVTNGAGNAGGDAREAPPFPAVDEQVRHGS